MVVGFALLKDVEVFLQGFLTWPASGVDTGKLLVLGIASPISAGDGKKLKVLQIAGVWNVWATAEVDEIALLVEGDGAFEFFDVFNLIFVGSEDFERFFLADFATFEWDRLFGELLQLRFDRGKVAFGDDLIAEVDVIVEAFRNRWAEAE